MKKKNKVIPTAPPNPPAKVGKPSDYFIKVQPRLNDVSYWVTLGYTNLEISKKLDISEASFYNYLNEYVEFLESINSNKALPNANIVNALYKKAVGETIVDTKHSTEAYYLFDKETGLKQPVIDKEGNPLVIEKTETITKKVQGDTKAMQFWLMNRDRENWQLSGSGGGTNISIDNKNLNINQNLNVNELQEKDIDEKILEFLQRNNEEPIDTK